MKTIVNVSNRLPITIGRTITPSSGGLATAMESLDKTFDLKWIGWAGGNIKDQLRREELKQEIVGRFKYIPVFLSPQNAEDYYDGYSNSSLWPLLHYMTTYSRFDDRWYQAYKKVNHIFAEAVLQVVQSGDMVWIHDYHLMLLPAILREIQPGLNIGFFLHTPFPSSEIFRCQPNREDLLQGLLGADLIGFQTFGYLRHFRSTVLRLLGLESEMNAIRHDRHETALGVYPIGINAGKIDRELGSETFEACLAEYHQAHEGKKVFLSVERLDYTKGIPRRLDAIEQFLDQSPYKEDVVFMFISVPSREDVEAYQLLVEEVHGRVSQINGKYSTITNVPVHFIHQSVNFSQLCALYALADVCLVTPMIDGMNLVAKEYVACQKEKTGVLILSEFAGAAQELPNALIVNPYDTNQLVDSFTVAMEMSMEEKQNRMASMRARVMRYDATYWATSFINDLTKRSAGKNIFTDTTAITLSNVTDLIHAAHIGLFLDYDGTLAEIKKKPADAFPNDETLDLFFKLAAIGHLDVFIVSGRKREDMERWFGAYPFTLVAEHGFFYRLPQTQEWEIFDNAADLGWMEKIVDIFQHYAGMTPGSAVEVKTSSVVWHYRESDPEFGSWKANQLVEELHAMLTNLPVEIHHGKKIVEVCSIQINKGMVMDYFVSQQQYDMSLCTGDDETDESMFRSLQQNMVSIKVGAGTTSALYRIPNPKSMRLFLGQLLDAREAIHGKINNKDRRDG